MVKGCWESSFTQAVYGRIGTNHYIFSVSQHNGLDLEAHLRSKELFS